MPLAVALAGTVLALGAGRGPPRARTLDALAYGVALGTGVLSMIAVAARALGLPRPGGGLPTLLLLALGALLLFLVRARKQPRLAPEAQPPSVPLPGGRAWFVLPVLALLGALAVAGDWRAPRPGGTWDAMAIWNLKARTLHRGTDDWARSLGDLRGVHHADYPLLLPATVAAQWDLADNENPRVPRNTSLLFLVALALLTYTSIARFTSRELAAAATALLLMTPVLVDNARAQTADLPLAYLLLAATSAAARLLHPDALRRPPAWLVGFLLALLPWTKNEGLVLATALGASLLVTLFLLRERLPPARILVGLAAGALLPLAALLVYRARWAPPDPLLQDLDVTLRAHLLDPERWSTALRGVFQQWSPWAAPGAAPGGWDLWGLGWIALAGLVVVGALRRRTRRPGPVWLLSAVALTTLGAYVLVYVLTPARSQEWHIRTSMPRLLLQLYPTLMLWACCLAAGRDDDAPQPSSAR